MDGMVRAARPVGYLSNRAIVKKNLIFARFDAVAAINATREFDDEIARRQPTRQKHNGAVRRILARKS